MTPDVASKPLFHAGIVVHRHRLRWQRAPRGRARPVPDSGVPRVVADAAREAVVDNAPLSGAGDGRFWELLVGIRYCGGRELRMQTQVVRSRGRVYNYVRCPLNQRAGLEQCPVNARMPAERAERALWEFVVRLWVEPEEMVSAMDAFIETERVLMRGNPEQEMRGLRRKLRDLEGRRERAQDVYLGGAFSEEELRVRQHQLDEAKEAVLREVDLCENRGRGCAAWWRSRTGCGSAPTPGTTSSKSTPTC